MTAPLVTIVIPNYNYGRYLRDAIESAVCQTYPNIEVLVLDNCSTDDSRAVMADYAHHERVRLVYNDENIGRIGNCNKGIALASGAYVAILSSDDMYVPEAIESLMQHHERHADLDFVYATVWNCDSEGRILSESRLEGHLPVREYAGRNELRALVTKYSFMWLPTCVFRKDALERAGSFSSEVAVAADWDLQVRMIADGGRCSFVNKALALIRFHGENATMSTYESSGDSLREIVDILDRTLRGPALEMLAGAESAPLRTIEKHAAMRTLAGFGGLASAYDELRPKIQEISARMEAARRAHRAQEVDGQLVSVIVAIPDEEHWGAALETIESVSLQTYPVVECVVIQRGFTDPGQDLDARAGVRGARWFSYTGRADRFDMYNAALDLTQGRLIVFADPGTLFRPDHVATAVRALDADPESDIVVSNTEVVLESEPPRFTRHGPMLARGVVEASVTSLTSNLPVGPAIPIDALLWRRDVFESLGGFVGDLGSADQWLLVLRGLHTSPLALTGETTLTKHYRSRQGPHSVGKAFSELVSQLVRVYEWFPVPEGSPLAVARAQAVHRIQALARTSPKAKDDEYWWDCLNVVHGDALRGGPHAVVA